LRPRVVYVPYGVANRFQDCIEIHKDLKKYPNLLKPILKHEFSHTDVPGLTWEDFKIDFFGKISLNRWTLYRFMLSRPSTWVQLLPFYFHPKRGLVIDFNRSILYLICLFIISLTFGSMILLKGGI
jgi:hypothetical protein